MDKENGAKLVIIDRSEKIRQIHLTDTVTFGRDEKKEADIGVHSQFLSALHGKIIKSEEGFAYQHLDTQNHTYYNGVLFGSKELDAKQPVKLEDGDVLRIVARKDEDQDEQAVVIIFRRRYDEIVEWRTVELEDAGLRLHIAQHEEAQGEGEVCAGGAELPRRYATLSYHGNTWTVEDKNTKYGVCVNNRKIKEKQELHNLDLIRIGNTTFLYWDDMLYYNHKDTSRNRLVIHIEERSVRNLFRKHVLLKDIDLDIVPGEMVLILGGSGAGKTTFINAVMGYEKAKGTIMEGDKDIYRNYNQMKYEIGFVPQQDLLRMEDTVQDTLDNAAELKLPRSTTPEERAQRIGEVLELFGLEREKESLVEKLSGGQRKRLSIAVEFIANPTLFFLDEPDSGLDGVMARFLMENLREIANGDKIVIVITHSPDRVEDLFDKVVVLAKGTEDNVGHLAFFGPVEEARNFFGCATLEEIVKKINRTDEGGEGLADQFIQKYAELEKKE